jgi:hypothetical protein
MMWIAKYQVWSDLHNPDDPEEWAWLNAALCESMNIVQ